MGKFKRTHVTIKEEQIDRILKFLNRSNTMVNYIRNTHDVRLSDVRILEEGIDELADMFHLYMPDYDHTGDYVESYDRIYVRKLEQGDWGFGEQDPSHHNPYALKVHKNIEEE